MNEIRNSILLNEAAKKVIEQNNMKCPIQKVDRGEYAHPRDQRICSTKDENRAILVKNLN
jgi:hypothetical protein